MSGPLAPTPRTKCRSAALVAVASGLFVALVGLSGTAQPAKGEDVSKGGNKIDRVGPLPADAPGQKVNDKIAIPNSNRAIFNQIKDFEPVAPESENPDEYQLWCEFVTHAKQFTATELDRHAARDRAAIELSRGPRALIRSSLLRFDGKLVCVRRLDAPLYFKNNPELGVTELYEARIVPLNESPHTPVSLVFTELPPALAGVLQVAPKEWLDVSTPAKETWVTASGYYFKTMNVPGAAANAVVGVPVLVGKSVTLIPGPPVPPGDDPTALDRSVQLFKMIKDDSPMIRAATGENWGEVAAQHYVLTHAARFAAEELERHVVPGVKFADLLEEVRLNYKLKTVRFEGRLISLRSQGSTDTLRASGINEVFEGWLVPATEPSGHPVCVLFTEPLAGVPVDGKEKVSRWVSFAGYSFKLMRYESGEKDKDDPTRYVVKKAPLLIGKAPILRPELDPDRPPMFTWTAFAWWAAGGIVAVLAFAGGLTWYNRRGDRQSKGAVDTVRGRNPFETASAPPPV